jgi:AraC family transcriptional regulator
MSPLQFRKMRGRGSEDLFLPEIMNPMESLKKQFRQRMEKESAYPCEFRTLPDREALVAAGRGFREGSFVLAANDAFARIIDHVERCGIQGKLGLRLSMLPYIPITFHDTESVIYCGFTLQEKMPAPDGFETIAIPGGSYAVFPCQGPYEFLSYVWNAAYFTCAFSGRHQLRNTPPFEVYLNSPRTIAPQELRTEIHIPVE